jgi:hypothetical protein
MTLRLPTASLIALLSVGCTGAPTSPAPTVAATNTWLVAGQSNALNLAPYIRVIHPDTLSSAETGMPISGWAPGQPSWLALEPLLRRPLRAVIWFQGESDWQAADTPPPGYDATLRDLFARIRQANNNPTVLIVVCGLATRYVPSIGSAQQAVIASDPNAIYVRSDDLPNDGSTHLSSEGLPLMAQRVADAIREH